MTWPKTKTVVVVCTLVVLGAGTTTMLMRKTRPAVTQEAAWTSAIPTAEQISAANVGLPDPQIDAKTLIFCAMAQKKIPAAANWCETLNAGGRLWPVTPTNTVFALNSQMAGRVYSRTIPGDTVVFFEAAAPGWNQTGGPELMAKRAGGVAVAFVDGRALIVSPGDVARLRWTP